MVMFIVQCSVFSPFQFFFLYGKWVFIDTYLYVGSSELISCTGCISFMASCFYNIKFRFVGYVHCSMFSPFQVFFSYMKSVSDLKGIH